MEDHTNKWWAGVWAQRFNILDHSDNGEGEKEDLERHSWHQPHYAVDQFGHRSHSKCETHVPLGRVNYALSIYIRKSGNNVIPDENHVLTGDEIATRNIQTNPYPVTEHETNPHQPFHPSDTVIESDHAQTEQGYQSLSHHCSVKYTKNHLLPLETSLHRSPPSPRRRFGN